MTSVSTGHEIVQAIIHRHGANIPVRLSGQVQIIEERRRSIYHRGTKVSVTRIEDGQTIQYGPMMVYDDSSIKAIQTGHGISIGCVVTHAKPVRYGKGRRPVLRVSQHQPAA